MAPSRETKEHLANAYKAAKAWGISKEEIKPVLRNLFQAVGGRWEDIEPDDYKIVVETYFESNRKVVPLQCYVCVCGIYVSVGKEL